MVYWMGENTYTFSILITTGRRGSDVRHQGWCQPEEPLQLVGPALFPCERSEAGHENRHAADPASRPPELSTLPSEQEAPNPLVKTDRVTMICDQSHGLGGHSERYWH